MDARFAFSLVIQNDFFKSLSLILFFVVTEDQLLRFYSLQGSLRKGQLVSGSVPMGKGIFFYVKAFKVFYLLCAFRTVCLRWHEYFSVFPNT